MRTGSNLEKAKVYNERLVLDLIRSHGRLSRSELARRTALTPPTVSNIVQSLLDQELVEPVGTVRGQRGHPSTLFALNPSGALSLGVNIDRDYTVGVLLDLAGQVVDQADRQTTDLEDIGAVRQAVQDVVRHLTRSAAFDAERVWGIGVGLPSGDRAFAPVSEFLRSDLLEALPDRAHVPVYVENNANAAGLGEYWYGQGAAYRSFFYVHVGMGLGGGLISDGAIYRGAADFAGEVGRTPVRSDGEPARPLEQIVSLHALAERLGLRNTLEPRERASAIGAAAEAKDDRYQAWLNEAGFHLADALIHVECLVDPDAIIVGGRLPVRVLDELIDRCSAHLEGLRDLAGKPGTPAMIRGQVGAKAGGLGVAVLPLYETIAPKYELLQKARIGAVS